MAVSGYCKACNERVPIVARELKPSAVGGDGRQRNWYPLPHTTPEGKPCGGEWESI